MQITIYPGAGPFRTTSKCLRLIFPEREDFGDEPSNMSPINQSSSIKNIFICVS